MVSGRWIPVQLAEGGPDGDGERSLHTCVAFPAFPERFLAGMQILKCQDLRICTDFHKISICGKRTVDFFATLQYDSVLMILPGSWCASHPNHRFGAGYRAAEQASQILKSGRKFSNI